MAIIRIPLNWKKIIKYTIIIIAYMIIMELFLEIAQQIRIVDAKVSAILEETAVLYAERNKGK